eukprot:CAMPEP_0116869078 /NCGR_PEP_ID=MMETSP0418-20121206/27558_1 /TAXON_ID=1158023 /ORGANISM="Astrosyne radiata, Strain 13vi08-1A" /LENGTH=279 /DNA_ID=CAMNT_0004505131 /DNA_START=67 /DNA_END=906 /DNA_ORIENTATION=+
MNATSFCKNIHIKVIPKATLSASEPNSMWSAHEPNHTDYPDRTNKNWLKSRFHFSFDYSNRRNIDFGFLRVRNQPHRGSGGRPHNNMEIITYVVDGELTHHDFMGTNETLGRGAIQFMTARTAIRHSEYNLGDKPLRFIETWINPSARNLTPDYGSCEGSAEERKNRLQHLVSNAKDPSTSTPVEINQDIDAYATELDLGKKVQLNIGADRQAYLLCIEGGVKVNGKELSRHDACEITCKEGGELEIEATSVEETENGKVAHVLMFVMKAVEGSGRSDI